MFSLPFSPLPQRISHSLSLARSLKRAGFVRDLRWARAALNPDRMEAAERAVQFLCNVASKRKRIAKCSKPHHRKLLMPPFVLLFLGLGGVEEVLCLRFCILQSPLLKKPHKPALRCDPRSQQQLRELSSNLNQLGTKAYCLFASAFDSTILLTLTFPLEPLDIRWHPMSSYGCHRVP